jgi:hypothetical protein
MTDIPYLAVLKPHPETAGNAVETIEARVTWREGGALALNYQLRGDLARLRIPPLQPPRQGKRLWEHTCFEAFISVTATTAYHECNFAPSGEWAAYVFRRYREPAPAQTNEWISTITAAVSSNVFQLDAVVQVDRFLRRDAGVPLRLGLSAVVEENGGRLSYWALIHPPGKPDFHDPDSFALEIGWPDADSALQPTAGRR